MANPSESQAPVHDPLVAQSFAFASTFEMWGQSDATGDARRPQLGQVVAGRYRVGEQLGAGGMGTVYRVHDELEGTDRALKLAHQRYAESDEGRLQFRQEFLVMASLQHPNLPRVLDYGFAESGAPFLVMELVPGDPLPCDAPMPLKRFYRLFVQFLRAVGFLHARGFLHRDIKPANALIVAAEGANGEETGERLVLLDFGLMERFNRPSEQAYVGTPTYMAPEIIKGRALDARTDLYSLGIAGFEMLTGQRPFQHHDLKELLRLHELAPRPPAAAINDQVPVALDELIRRMMAASPSERPTSAEDVLQELTRLTDEVDKSDQSARRSFLRLTEIIGRETQLAAIDSAFQNAGLSFAMDSSSMLNSSRKEPACLLLEGATGAGKSRLLHEAQIDGLVRGMIVSGVSIREEHRSSYHALRVLVRGLLPAARQLECLPAASKALARLLPAGTLPTSEHDGMSDVSPQEERGLMIAETAAWLEALSALRPVLLIVDDLQWCDESSLLVLMSLSRRLTSGGVVLLGAYRVDEVEAGSDLDQWRRLDEVSTVGVSGFDEAQMESFLSALLGRHSLGREFIHRSTGLTDGRPFFVIELLRELIDADVLVRRNGVWQLVDAAVSLPESLTGLIRHRLDRLNAPERQLALQLAVAGGVLPLTAIESLLGIDRDPLLTACENLIQQRVAEQTSRGLALVHDSLREVVYQTADEQERRGFHQRLAEHFERELDESHSDRAVLLGHHFTRGNDPHKGLGFLETAGEEAFEHEQHGVARNLLTEAERLLLELPDVPQRQERLYRVRKMLMVVCVSNDFEQGAQAGEWVFQTALRRSLPSLPGLQRVLPNPFAFLAALALHLPWRSVRRGRAAFVDLEADLNDVFLASGYLCNSLAAQSLLTTSRRRAERLRAFALSRRSLPLAVMQIAQTIGKYHQEPTAIDDFAAALETMQHSPQFRKLDEYTQNIMLGVCHYARAIFDAWEQDAHFEEHFRISEEHAQQTGNHFTHHLNIQALVEREVFGGNVRGAERAEALFVESLQKFGGKAKQREWLVHFAMGQFDVCCGRFDRAARRAERLYADGPGYFTEGYASLIEARLKLARGDCEGSLQDAARALRWARDPEVLARLFEFRVESCRADALIQLDRPAQAAEAIESMQGYADLPGHTTTYFQAETLRRQAELTARVEPLQAPALAREALQLAAQNESRLQLAESHATLANTLTVSGGSDEAIAHLHRAAEIYSNLGNRYREELVRRRLPA